MNLAKLMSFPPVASAHGQDIDMVIYLIHIIMVVLFVGWGIYFVIAVLKFNKRANPKANYVGTTSHVSSYVEIGVAVAEAVILLGFSIPFWAKQVNAFPNRSDAIEVKIMAEQFAWNIHYAGPDNVFGKTDVKYFNKQSNPIGLDPNDPNGKDDVVTINKLNLPIGRPAIIHLTSRDVMHSFSLPIMRVKQDVIPGMSIPTWFTPTKTGDSEIACAQLCGIGHYRMKGFLKILSQEDFDAWLKEQSAQAQSNSSGGDDFWN